MIDRLAALADIVAPSPVAAAGASVATRSMGWELGAACAVGLLLLLALWRLTAPRRAIVRLQHQLDRCADDAALPALAARAARAAVHAGLAPDAAESALLQRLRYAPNPDRPAFDALLQRWQSRLRLRQLCYRAWLRGRP